jgi:hypothetical protein
MPSVERTKWTSVAGQYVRRGFDSGRKSADCLIRDVCYEGARIIFSDPVNIPDVSNSTFRTKRGPCQRMCSGAAAIGTYTKDSRPVA